MATKKEGDGNHPSSHYLVVEDASKPSTWHLRVRNVSGELDHTLMGAAWAALHGGYRGNTYQGPNKAQALSKLTKLYRSEGMALPSSKSWFYKDRSGQQWFVGIYSNNFKDREGETFTWESHLEFTKWVKETGVKLPVTVMHQPKYPSELHAALLYGLMKGMYTAKEFSDSYLKLYKPFVFAQTEAIIPVNGFVLVVAKILKGKEDAVKLLQNSGWGMSHGFFALNRDSDDTSVITQYRSFELTTLPAAIAANWITTSTIKEIFDMDAFKGMAEEDRQKVEELLKANPDDLAEGLGEFQRILSTFMESKELDQEEADEKENQEEEVEVTEYEQVRDKIFADFKMEQLSETFTSMVDALKNLQQRVEDMDNRLKEAERSEDEKVAEKFYAPNWDMWNKGTDEEPSDEEKEQLKDKALGEGSIEGTGDKQVTPDDNPLAWSVANIFAR